MLTESLAAVATVSKFRKASHHHTMMMGGDTWSTSYLQESRRSVVDKIAIQVQEGVEGYISKGDQYSLTGNQYT